MQLTVAGAGAKHTLDVTPEDTVRAVKQRLEPLTGMAYAEMKLVVKGKAPDDGSSLASLGVADGAKLMLLRGKPGAAKKPAAGTAGGSSFAAAAAASAEAASIVAGDGAAATAAAAAPAPALVAGDGPLTINVAQGRQQMQLRCEPSSTVGGLRELLSTLTGAEPAQHRLLYKGRELKADSSVGELGLDKGGKLMLLFKGAHHQHVEGSAVISDAASGGAALRERVEKAVHRASKRLQGPAETLAELGALEGEVNDLCQDLRNANVTEDGAADADRKARLEELQALAATLQEARSEAAKADLMAQLGR